MRHERLTLFSDSLSLRFAAEAAEHAAPRNAEDLERQLERLSSGGVERLTLTGGSPLAHPSFDAILSDPRVRSVTHLGVETDAASLSKPGVIERLVAGSVEEAFIVLGGARRASHERMLQSDDFDATLDGIERALQSPLRVYFVVVATRLNLRDVLAWAERAADGQHKATGLLLAAPRPRDVSPDARRWLVHPVPLAELAARVFERCQRSGIEYGFFDRRAVSPCLSHGVLDGFGTVFHERFAFLEHEPGEAAFERVTVCQHCSLRASCPGLESDVVSAFGSSSARPVPLESSMGWKLRPIHSLDRTDFKNVSPFATTGDRPPRTLLRINGHCNMSCSFCFVDRTVPDFPAGQLEASIQTLRDAGGRHLVLSGGEPTLHPELPRLIQRGRDLGFDIIEVQTNGVRAANEEYASELVSAGLNRATVSLHSIDPEQSDRVTRLPGGFDKSLRAIHNFRRLGITTQIAHVITKANYRELPTTVRFLAREFPSSGGHLSLCLAVAQGISDLVYSWVVPTFTEIKPYVRDALDYCLDSDVGFGGMIGQGGYPPCMLDGALKYYAAVLDQVFVSDDHDDQFHKADRCRECSFDEHCVGVRRAYVDCHGEAEIQPFSADVSAFVARFPGLGGPRLVQLRRKERAVPSVND